MSKETIKSVTNCPTCGVECSIGNSGGGNTHWYVPKTSEKLVELQKEYIILLGEEISELVGIASTHGWSSTRHEAGQILRDKIKELANDN